VRAAEQGSYAARIASPGPPRPVREAPPDNNKTYKTCPVNIGSEIVKTK